MIELIRFLEEQSTGLAWRLVLNNHTTNRSKKTVTRGGKQVGGSIIDSIEKNHTKRSLEQGMWEIVMDFPNSLEPQDGVHIAPQVHHPHRLREDGDE